MLQKEKNNPHIFIVIIHLILVLYRLSHVYMSGLIKSFGLILFTWMSLSGSLMFFFLEPGMKAKGFIHLVKEMHEAGEMLIPLYVIIHIGAVIIHAMYGRHIWKPMVFLKNSISSENINSKMIKV